MLPYLCDVVDPVERQEVREHLARGCPTCHAALAEANAVLGLLPLALDPVAPPAPARRHLIQKVGEAATAPPMRIGPDPERAGGARPGRARTLVPAAIAALFAVVATVAVTSVGRKEQARQLASLSAETQQQAQQLASQSDQVRQAEKKAADLEQTNQLLQVQVTDLRKASQQQSQLVALVQSPAVKVLTLDGAAQKGARAQVFWDEQSRQWHVYASNLNRLDRDKTYELWFITTDQKKIPAGTFTADANGNASTIVKVPADIGQIALAAITDEPAGGVPQPTGQIQLVGKFQ
jgi:hypothetical protein